MLKENLLAIVKILSLKTLIALVLIVLVSVGANPAYGKGKSGRNVKSYPLTPEITQEIVTRAKHYGLPPLVVLEVMRQESSFNPNACSSANARGLMQFIPSTAKRFGITDPHNVAQSIDAGCRYLAFLIRKFDGRLDLVLAGYNAGEGAVERYGNRVPPYEETQNYVKTIITNYKRALLVKEAFLKRNNIVLVEANRTNQTNQPRPGASTSYRANPTISKKSLTKRQMQEKLAGLDDFSTSTEKLVTVKRLD